MFETISSQRQYVAFRLWFHCVSSQSLVGKQGVLPETVTCFEFGDFLAALECTDFSTFYNVKAIGWVALVDYLDALVVLVQDELGGQGVFLLTGEIFEKLDVFYELPIIGELLLTGLWDDLLESSTVNSPKGTVDLRFQRGRPRRIIQ